MMFVRVDATGSRGVLFALFTDLCSPSTAMSSTDDPYEIGTATFTGKHACIPQNTS